MFGFGKKPGPTLGLDINSSTISVIQIEKTKTDTKVSRFSSMPTPPDIVREGLLADPEAVGTAVRELLDLVGIPDKKPIPVVNIGIPGQAVVIRLMPVPTGMPPDELSDVVQQEAINNLPFPLDEANIDFCLLPATERTDPDGVRRVDVLLAAIQRIVVDSYWRMAETANIKLGRLDISSLAVIRALACAGMLKDDGQMTMAVNIRNDATDITLIKRGMPLFSRSVLLGVETLGEAISRSIDAPMDEALALLPKIQLGSVPTSDPRIGQAAQVARSVFGDLTAEVGRSLEFYMSQVGSIQVDQVILSGPGCIVPGIHEFVSNRLNIQTVVADPFQNIIYDKAQILDDRRAVHAMLIGLIADSATAPIKSVEVDLNKQGRSSTTMGDDGGEEGAADTGEPEEEVDTPWFVPAMAGGVTMLMAAVLAWAALAFYFGSNKQAELAELEQTVQTSKSAVQQLDRTQGELNSLNERKTVLEKIVVHGQPRSVVLRLLKDSVPQGVQVTSMELSDNNLSLGCTGVDFAKASNFAINLEGSNMVDDVSLSNLHRAKKNPSQVVFKVSGDISSGASKVNPDDFKLAALQVDLGTPVAQASRAKMTTGRPTVIYFIAQNNPICKIFEPKYEQMKARFSSTADFKTVDFDTDEGVELAAKYKVPSAPDFVVADEKGNGERLTGTNPMLALTEALGKYARVAGGNGQH